MPKEGQRLVSSHRQRDSKGGSLRLLGHLFPLRYSRSVYCHFEGAVAALDQSRYEKSRAQNLSEGVPANHRLPLATEDWRVGPRVRLSKVFPSDLRLLVAVATP